MNSSSGGIIGSGRSIGVETVVVDSKANASEPSDSDGVALMFLVSSFNEFEYFERSRLAFCEDGFMLSICSCLTLKACFQ